MPLTREEFTSIGTEFERVEKGGEINYEHALEIIKEFVVDDIVIDPNASTGRNPRFVVGTPISSADLDAMAKGEIVQIYPPKSNLTVEYVKGMIQTRIKAMENFDKLTSHCLSDLPSQIKCLSDLLKEINEAENDAK